MKNHVCKYRRYNAGCIRVETSMEHIFLLPTNITYKIETTNVRIQSKFIEERQIASSNVVEDFYNMSISYILIPLCCLDKYNYIKRVEIHMQMIASTLFTQQLTGYSNTFETVY